MAATFSLSSLVFFTHHLSCHPPSGWSAPSAIALGGLGGGFEVGVEMTDFVIVLNSASAVDSFKKGSNVTLGGNLTVAVGPLGRNMEGDVSLRNAASFYTYSKSRYKEDGIGKSHLT